MAKIIGAGFTVLPNELHTAGANVSRIAGQVHDAIASVQPFASGSFAGPMEDNQIHSIPGGGGGAAPGAAFEEASRRLIDQANQLADALRSTGTALGGAGDAYSHADWSAAGTMGGPR